MGCVMLLIRYSSDTTHCKGSRHPSISQPPPLVLPHSVSSVDPKGNIPGFVLSTVSSQVVKSNLPISLKKMRQIANEKIAPGRSLGDIGADVALRLMEDEGTRKAARNDGDAVQGGAGGGGGGGGGGGKGGRGGGGMVEDRSAGVGARAGSTRAGSTRTTRTRTPARQRQGEADGRQPPVEGRAARGEGAAPDNAGGTLMRERKEGREWKEEGGDGGGVTLKQLAWVAGVALGVLFVVRRVTRQR